MTWDLFISHASEDKEEVAQPLANMFINRGLKVWYDKYTLTVGDSLRRCIDRGLAECRYGLVILSKHFFGKEWTQKELDGLVAREDGLQKRILPVWHKVTRSEVVAFSPLLADKLGVSTAKGLEHVVDEIVRAIEEGAHSASVATPSPKTEPQGTAPCSSSANWVLLHTQFFKAHSVRQNHDGTSTLEIPSHTAEEDAAVQGLRPPQHSEPIAFAHRNDGLVVRVKNIEAHSTADQQFWTITVAPERIEYGGGWMEGSLGIGSKNYSADEIATLRARRILLNDPPAMPDLPGWQIENILLESHIQGTGTKFPIKNCILRAVYAEYQDRPHLLPVARLAVIYALKAGDVVEQVLELSLGPILAGKCHVKFRGRRRRKYSNVEPHVMQIEGECPLE